MNEELLRQLLEGMELPHDSPIRCSECFAKLRDGAFINVVARRCYGMDGWEIAAVFCPSHAPDTVPEVPHGRSVLLDAEVGTLVNTMCQTHSACLIEVELRDTALEDDPDELPEVPT